MNEDQPIGHNYLAVIAADIRALHASVRRSAEQAARDAIEAGRLLIEAKRALPHGQWEAWLREHATISPRTARRYMRIAAAGLDIGHVADLGLVATSRRLLARDSTIARIRRLARDGWAHVVEAGRQYDAILGELGEERFRAWAKSKTGVYTDEALFLAEVARVTDAGGDVAALLARDDVPKALHLTPPTEPEATALRERLMQADAAEAELWNDT